MLRTQLFLIGLLFVPSAAAAQNVSNYGAVPEPFLFLLREPAIHMELGLDDDQQARLRELNERHDGDLLATRNMSPEKGQPIVATVMSTCRREVADILSPQQRDRLRQITYRLRGISFVLLPEAASQLNLRSDQKVRIKKIVARRQKKIADLQKRMNDGEGSQLEVARGAQTAFQNEQRQVLAELDAMQRRQVGILAGTQFDTDRLGRVSFQAPELSESADWVNTEPLHLSQLKGKVIALHFWAFG
jgi:hypothetical protein